MEEFLIIDGKKIYIDEYGTLDLQDFDEMENLPTPNWNK